MKKILGLVMVVVLALCLGGCGQDAIPKADYRFTVEKFVVDWSSNEVSNSRDVFQDDYSLEKLEYSVVKTDKIYKNKRIEISGKIRNKFEKNNDFQFLFYASPGENLFFAPRVSLRDKNNLDRLKEGDFVKISCLFSRTHCQVYDGTFIIAFDFTDGILISKL